ncbi:MAG: DNA-3-methyladenine glycosylase 2 family protein [Clostridia bacterium]|nr:DNA-3-methyladenine glycosylase 2 family protein [Clostridia bacterium]
MITTEKYVPVGIMINGIPAVRIGGLEHFDVSQVFDCGQAFRFLPVGDDPYHVGGVAFGKYIELVQSHDTLTIVNATVNDYEGIWKRYLGLDLDYGEIKRELTDAFARQKDSGVFENAVKIGGGIRLLRQEPWECLCSFIISQNNNIPRIRKIIGALCEKYGEPIRFGESVHYSFPSAHVIADAGIDEIFALRTGFRAKYICDAARAVSTGELELDALKALEPNEVERALCSVKGVGPKVAACAMLFSLEKYDAFPIDVWVKRILEKYYPDGLDISALGRYAGIAQQYLFFYERYTVNAAEPKDRKRS